MTVTLPPYFARREPDVAGMWIGANPAATRREAR